MTPDASADEAAAVSALTAWKTAAKTYRLGSKYYNETKQKAISNAQVAFTEAGAAAMGTFVMAVAAAAALF